MDKTDFEEQLRDARREVERERKRVWHLCAQKLDYSP